MLRRLWGEKENGRLAVTVSDVISLFILAEILVLSQDESLPLDYHHHHLFSQSSLDHPLEQLFSFGSPLPEGGAIAQTGSYSKNNTTHYQRFKAAHHQDHLCPHCGKGLSSNHGLRRHIIDKHTIHTHSYQCHICQRTYRTPNSLQNHISVYHKKRDFPHPPLATWPRHSSLYFNSLD